MDDCFYVLPGNGTTVYFPVSLLFISDELDELNEHTESEPDLYCEDSYHSSYETAR